MKIIKSQTLQLKQIEVVCTAFIVLGSRVHKFALRFDTTEAEKLGILTGSNWNVGLEKGSRSRRSEYVNQEYKEQ